ncbi:hypothetical protein D082_04660 [Synechocystis sp. PCC 6714]|nr:hypothetical protein D082_04660 [Synechocystis sp. PCC 6714]
MLTFCIQAINSLTNNFNKFYEFNCASRIAKNPLPKSI